MVNDSKSKIKTGLLIFVFFVLSISAVSVCAWLMGLSVKDIMSQGSMMACLYFVMILVLYQSVSKEPLYPGAMGRLYGFLLIYILGILLCLLSYWVSPLLIPVQAIALFVMLFSNVYCGIISLMSYDVLAWLISGYDAFVFVYIFMAGLILLLLFFRPQKSMYIVRKAIIYLFLNIPLYIALVLFQTLKFDVMSIAYPLVGMAITIVIMLLFLRIYSKSFWKNMMRCMRE